MSPKEEIEDIIMAWRVPRASTEILLSIVKRIDEKIQHVNEVLEDPRLTIQGCQRLKGKKDGFEEVKEMLSSPQK